VGKHGTLLPLGSPFQGRLHPREGYGLFGIVQGSVYADLRKASADALLEIGFEATPSAAWPWGKARR